MGAGAHRADRRPRTIGAAQPAEQLAVVDPLRAEAAAQGHGRGAPPRSDRDLGERLPGRDHAAVARPHRPAILGHDLPGVQLPVRHAIGDPQRLQRRGERDHREIGDEDEGESIRATPESLGTVRRLPAGDDAIHGGRSIPCRSGVANSIFGCQHRAGRGPARLVTCLPARRDEVPTFSTPGDHGRCSVRYARDCTQARSGGRQLAAGYGCGLAEVPSEQLATKHDIHELRSELRQLEQRLTIELGGMIAAAVPLVAILLRLL
jgi:hypothetical protein